MEGKILNIFFRFSGWIFSLKNRLIKAHGWYRILPLALLLILAEVIFSLISLPLYFVVKPKQIQQKGIFFPGNEKSQLQNYLLRRKIILATTFGAGSIFGLKVLAVGIFSFYLLGAQILLADTQDWTFSTAGDYTYDSAKIEVTGGAAQLKNLGGTTNGGTTNSGFDTNSTGWTFVNHWVHQGGGTNTGNYQSAGGNPGGYIDINQAADKNKSEASYWYQSFTTTGTPTTATLDFDWKSITFGSSGIVTYKMYAFVDTTSGNPTLGTEVWSSGEISSTTSWASVPQINIAAKVPSAGTYYVKLGVYITRTNTNPPSSTYVVGFDDAAVNWSVSSVSYDTGRPTILPNTSLNPAKALTWDSFTEIATKNGGEIYYQLSDDDGASWKYWSGSAWVVAGASNYNTASIVNSNIATFPTVTNKIKWKAFLESNGTQQVILDNISIGYTQNSLPVVASVTPVQNTSAGYVYVNYNLQDNNSDPLSLTAYEYSLTGAFAGEQVTMSPVLADPEHDGVSGLSSLPGGVAHTFVWDAKSQIGAIYDGTVYVRLRANDGIGDSPYTISSAFVVDYVLPIVTNVSALQTLGTTNIVITYDLADDTTVDAFVEVDISEDGGLTWSVTDTSVSGAVGTGITTGVGNTITWLAKTDFTDQVQSDLQVRVRARDKWQNQGLDVASVNFALDTLSPTVATTANLQAQPNAGDTVAMLGGSFTETNPNTNDFYLAVNDGAYSSATVGTANTAAPANQNTVVGATLDGNDYISKVKITHTDDFGQTGDNENASPATIYKFVKPYTPSAPTLSLPATTNLNLTINPHGSEAGDLQYAMVETTTNKYVQSDGTLGDSAYWRSSGTINVNGLSSPLSQYIFKVKSRNPNDGAHAESSESSFSATSQITNTAPAVDFGAIAQTTNGTQYVTVNYTGTDGQGDICSLPVYEYSTNNVDWFTMTEKLGVGSDGVSNLIFLSGGSAHDFVWDSGADLPNSEYGSVKVRVRPNDSLIDGTLATSSTFAVDQKAPIISNVSALQDAGASTVTISYDLSDANSSLVEVDISEDGGLSWSVADTAVSGAVGSGVAPGVGKTITWNAGTDFDGQYQGDLRVRLRALDTFGNQGGNVESGNFTLDTKDPAVTSMSASQDSAAKTFTFNYDLAEDAGNVDVAIVISSNSGSSFVVPATSLLGDVGAGIVPGVGQTVTWDAGVDYDGFEKSTMRFRVTATDSFSNSGVTASSDFSLDTLAPRVTSVSAVQNSGTTNVAITYTLADQNNSLVEIDISEDAGISWTVIDTAVTGDVGAGVTGGSKNITWLAGTDFDNQDQADLRVRVRAKDIFENQSANVSSGNFSVDTLDPVVNAVADLLSQPNAGDATVLIGGSFTENNPNTNNFYVALNGGIYGSATAGQTNTASPANQATVTSTTLDGNDYVSKIKIVHTDDFGQSLDNEDASPATAYQYVKPYTPATPTVDNPVFSAVNVTINKNLSETDGLEYVIFETSQNKYVQTDGTLGASATWQTLGTSLGQWGFTSGTSGLVTVSGLVNDSYTYQFKTVSRNTSDVLNAASSESAMSGGASSDNQSPVIVLGAISQTTDGTKYVTINYTGSDLESEASNVITAEYSVNGTNWFSMSEKSGVGSDGTVGLAFARTGTVHDFMWDVATDLPNTEDSTVYIRLQANDSTSSGAIVTSGPFTVDIKDPVTSAVTAVQNDNSGLVTITYTLVDLSNSIVSIDISEDAGVSWTVLDTSVTGEVGNNIASGTDKTINWSASADFTNQEQSDLRVRVRATDNFGNAGVNASSGNFELDTKVPEVSNVTAVQDAGLNTVTINYDLVDGNDSTVTITISEDNGLTWGVATSTLAGDVGAGISSGAGKIVTWNAAADFPNREQSGMKVRVQATDAFANASGDIDSSAFAIDTNAPVVSNVSASQTLSTDDVVFTYDLADSGLSTVALDISNDSGVTWDVIDSSVVGQVGAGISAGNNKTITWSAALDSPDVESTSFRVRIRGTDPYQNSSSDVSSVDFSLDTLAPVVNAVTDVILQPQAGDSSVLVGGSFNESNPNTNNFYLNLNGAGYASATVGQTNSATPANQLVAVGATLDGDDYVSAVKVIHVDDFAHEETNENSSLAISEKFVKPYTPATPNVNNPQSNSVDVLVIPYILETAGLEYAIYEITTDSYVQADGSLGLAEQWQTTATWGTVTVIGLSSPVASYNFRVKSRNVSDLSNALSSESNLSNIGSVANTAPSIVINDFYQELNSNYVSIKYVGTDSQNDINDLTAFEYSVDNIAWYTMTENTEVDSDGTSDLVFASTGTEYIFAWDLATDLPNFADATVYARLQSSDTLANSNLAVSSAFSVDTLGPVITNIQTSQAPGSRELTITYDLADDTTSNNDIVITISSDGGATWTVPITTLAGDVGAGVSAGVDRTVTWDADIDFNNQENNSMRVSIQGTDSYSNTGNVTGSSNFVADAGIPVVSAVTATQNSGSGDVIIDYTISDLSAGGLFTDFELSANGGVTWDVIAVNYSGDIGVGQTTGLKTFTWNAGLDYTGQFEDQMQVRVRAEDYFGNQGGFSASLVFAVDTLAPTFTNISANQTAGTSLVDIYYDLSDDSDVSNVSLQISEDGGITWNVPIDSAIGNIDDEVEVGTGNLIVWDANADFAGNDLSSLRVQLIGTDSLGNISSGFESANFDIDTVSPTGLANLEKFASTTDSVTLVWSEASDINFDHYELWYGNNQLEVQSRSGSANLWSVAEDATLSDSLTIFTEITGLTLDTDLFVKIWAVDEFGFEATTDDINVFEPDEPEAPVIVEGTGGASGAQDTVAPARPILNSVVSPTNQTTITVSGLTAPLSQIDLYDGEVWVLRFTQSSSYRGYFSQEIEFAEGIHRLSVRATDLAGNISEPSIIVQFSIDLTPPDRPDISNQDNIEVLNVSPIVVGTSEPNAIIDILVDDSRPLTTVADQDGNWRYLLPSDLSLGIGPHVVSARATDLAGNIGSSATWLFNVIDGVVDGLVVAPVITPGALVAPSLIIPVSIPLSPIAEIISEEASAVLLPSLPIPEVNFTTAFRGRNLSFGGRAMPNSDVIIYIHSTQALVYQAKSDQEGDWNIVHSQDVTELIAGDHSIYAVAIDTEAKVKSVPSQVMAFTIEKNLWATLYGYLNLQTTLIALGVLLLSMFLLYRFKKGNKL